MISVEHGHEEPPGHFGQLLVVVEVGRDVARVLSAAELSRDELPHGGEGAAAVADHGRHDQVRLDLEIPDASRPS